MHNKPLCRRRVLCALALCAAWPVGASGSTWPEVSADLRALGSYPFRYWGLSVYQAELSVAAGFDPERYAQHRLALGLTYARSLKGSAIAERSLSEMRALAQRSGLPWRESQAAQWLRQLRALIPDVQAGDRITGVNHPQQGTTLFFNQTALGTIEGNPFAELFFGIWLSPLTPEPAMRQALLNP